MGDDRHEKIKQRAYAIWEREGQLHGDHDLHWCQAKDELDRDDVSTPEDDDEIDPEADSKIAGSDVLSVEALAMRTGISGDQAQDLMDRLGNDRAAIEDAARSLALGQRNFSK